MKQSIIERDGRSNTHGSGTYNQMKICHQSNRFPELLGSFSKHTIFPLSPQKHQLCDEMWRYIDGKGEAQIYILIVEEMGFPPWLQYQLPCHDMVPFSQHTK
jgi:hypothetical protein